MSESYLALHLLLSGDPLLWDIVRLSVLVSLSATLLALLIGLPLGALIALNRFPGREPAIIVLNALMGLPPVVVGLGVYLALFALRAARRLGLLFTPLAMVIAQTVWSRQSLRR